jgi:DNA polymerase III gamma/tau subunit
MAIRVPWVEKYRPRKIDDFVGLPGIKTALKTFLRSPAGGTGFAFIGPPGIGKTAMALVMAEELNITQCARPRYF